MIAFKTWLFNTTIAKFLGAFYVGVHFGPAMWGLELTRNRYEIALELGPLRFTYDRWWATSIVEFVPGLGWCFGNSGPKYGGGDASQ